MPIPEQREGETDEEFIQRCMSDETMKREYPKQEGEKFPSQRYAVCQRQLNDNSAESAVRSQEEEGEGSWHGIPYDSAHEQVETAEEGAEWDANEAMSAADPADYYSMCALERGDAGGTEDAEREDYKLPHHDENGRVYKAAVDNAAARLPQVEGIPDSARSTADAHITRHQEEDFDEETEDE